MRRISSILWIMLFSVAFSGCCVNSNIPAEAYLYSKWVSKYPQMWVTILPIAYGSATSSDEKTETRNEFSSGKLMVHGEEIEIIIMFEPNYGITVYREYGDERDRPQHEILLVGKGEYELNRFVLHITEDRQSLFGDSLDEILFFREAYMPEGGVAGLKW